MNFSDRIKELYNVIKNFEIKDFYAHPKAFGNTVTQANIWELVENSYKNDMLKLCGFDLNRASDFEKLYAWTECISLMPDNALKLIYSEEIKAVLGEEADITDACDTWKRYNAFFDADNSLVGDITRNNDVNRVIYPNKSLLVGENPINSVFDINLEIDLVKGKKDKSFSDWCERIICAFKNKRPPYDIAVDIKDIEFVRGDYYHAGIAFDKLAGGEDVSMTERGQIFFHMLCELASKLGNDAVLHLNIGDNLSCAREFVSYLCMRNICPRIAIGATPQNAGLVKKLTEICLASPEKIYLELVFGIEDTPRALSGRLEALLSVYPAARLKFGGVMGDSKLLVASHIYVRKAVCQAISEIAADGAAESIVKAIFS